MSQPDTLTLEKAVFTVLEGFTLPPNVRKVLEAAYYNRSALSATQPAQAGWCPGCSPDNCQGCGPAAKTAQAAQGAGEVVGWAIIKDGKVVPGLIDRPRVAEMLRGAGETLRPLTYADTQPAAGADVLVWGWAIVDRHGVERSVRARMQDFFGSIQEASPFSLEDIVKADREFAGCAPHRVIALYTQPQSDFLMDALRDNSWDLVCFEMPTGADDADIGWRVIGHYMGKPSQRVIAEVFKDDPSAAIRAAIAARAGGSESV